MTSHPKIKVTVGGPNPLHVMFEPSGMIYTLGPDDHLIAEVIDVITETTEVVSWEGGISIWAPGSVRVYDGAGQLLHELN